MQRNHSTTSRISVLALLVVLIIGVTFLMEETVAWIATTTTTPMTGIRTLPIVFCDRSSSSSSSPRRTAAVASSPRASTVARRGSSIFYEVDPDECPDEEECEINWDLMPGFAENEDTEDEETATTQQKEAEAVYASQQLTQQHTLGKYERTTVTKSRMLLDMTWQIEQCEVEEEAEAMATSLSSSSSCTDFCAECAGAGTHYCNFCRGTRTIAFGNGEFRTCLICNNEGKMPCSSCQGSGHVATWIPELYQQQQPPHD